MPLIEVRKLKKIYSTDDTETPALDGITFDIEKGAFVAIMGPSGSGKSTLLHILGFLDRQTEGEYRFDGKTLEDYSKKDVARVRNEKMGFVFQSFNLLARTSVLENVKMPLLYSEVPEEQWEDRSRRAIDAVGLSHRIHYVPSQLSGGEKQRAAIARALVNDPQVIFADEPTGNLDSKTGNTIISLMQRLNEERGHTIIVITHESHIASQAKRLIYLRDGMLENDTIN